jgi:hypothetical protein
MEHEKGGSAIEPTRLFSIYPDVTRINPRTYRG